MRLNPGVTMARADEVLTAAETTWTNAGGGGDYYSDYHDAVGATYEPLRECFAEPDLAGDMQSGTYWHLVALRLPDIPPAQLLAPGVWNTPNSTLPAEVRRAHNEAFRREIGNRQRALASAREQLKALSALAARPGLPLVLDTNILNHWRRPAEIDWPKVLRQWDEPADVARIVVPLRVVDELDSQKYGDGPLAKRASRAVRGLYDVFKGREAGKPVPIVAGHRATLEIWLAADQRDADPDMAILRCAADLNHLHDGGARVVTGDLGMRLRAQNMDLKVRELPDEYRKQIAAA
ncbi:PIN domain-containing protein [Actinoplanes sp. NPDC023936]|uniref:PIN domain-containing protein n=1 Tax=Actinoplanes sp. NPDC023936 TaxID=3154910 RepID=UPI0033DB1549